MKKKLFILLGVLWLVLACQVPSFLPTPTPTAVLLPTLSVSTPTPFPPEAALETETPLPTPTPVPSSYGPSAFPPNINPLTGLQVANPLLLERRPIMVKVSNLPRIVRPQAGLSLADIVYEYYTEEGTTRFAAIFYGQDASKVGSIRSGRLFDAHLIPMYKSFFVFGGADQRILERLYGTGYQKYMIFEWQARCPAMCREAPAGYDMLFGNTQELSAYATRAGLDNERQNLDGMLFTEDVPVGVMLGNGQQVEIRYSAVIYNRWVYDPSSGRYFRYVDADNASLPADEVYIPLIDALNGQHIAADNVVIILTPNEFYSTTPEIADIALGASGTAYLFRDGQAYPLSWQHKSKDSVLTLANSDGSPFPFKSGTTWFEIMGVTSVIEQGEAGWRFGQRFP